MRLVDAMGKDDVAPDGATWMTLMSGARYLGRPDVVEMVSALQAFHWLIKWQSWIDGHHCCGTCKGPR